jgi:triacylglycerol lipase
MSVRRARLAIGGLVALLALGAVPAGAFAADPPDPILLVHGYRGDPSTWADMITAFGPGRTVEAINLPGEDNVANARAIRDLIAARGWSRVDLVAQSMGGLSARYLVKGLKSKSIDAYVSLGTPQYGLSAACLLPYTFGGQMCPSSRFLRDLNRGDDTPGQTDWTTIYSTSDGIVPVSSSRLDGGACHVEVSGVGHNEMDNDPGIFAHVLAAVDGTCTGTIR